MMSPANLNSAVSTQSSIKPTNRSLEPPPDVGGSKPVTALGRAPSAGPDTPLVPEAPGHSPVLWPVQIDPVAVHAAVLIAQEAYRNQKALEGLAMLVQVSTGAKADVARAIGRPTVPPPTAADAQGNDSFSG